MPVARPAPRTRVQVLELIREVVETVKRLRTLPLTPDREWNAQREKFIDDLEWTACEFGRRREGPLQEALHTWLWYELYSYYFRILRLMGDEGSKRALSSLMERHGLLAQHARKRAEGRAAARARTSQAAATTHGARPQARAH